MEDEHVGIACEPAATTFAVISDSERFRETHVYEAKSLLLVTVEAMTHILYASPLVLDKELLALDASE